MSTLTYARKQLMRPGGLLMLLILAVALWAMRLRGQLSPARQHLEAGIDAARQHRPADAEREWQEAARLSPDDPQPWNYLSEYDMDTFDWPAALEALHHLERLKPDAPHLQARLALCSLQSGDERSAYTYAAASLQKEPDDPNTILLFCGLLEKTHENQRRLDLLRRLASLKPDSLAVQLLLATTLADKRQFDEAAPLVEQILRRDPGNLEAHSLRGMIILNTDTSPQGLKRAEADLLSSVNAPRYAAFSHFNLGKIYKRLNQPQTAVTHLAAAAQAMPTRREVWYELADAYTRAGQPQQAETARRRSEALLKEKNDIGGQ
jgi:predicted Zn-dependent protease